jgi:drug/metabolite transporter superfamily protein YnfA
MSKFRIFGEFFAFARAHKAYWLLPAVVVLVLFGMLLVFAEGSAFAPFIYTIF